MSIINNICVVSVPESVVDSSEEVGWLYKPDDSRPVDVCRMTKR